MLAAYVVISSWRVTELRCHAGDGGAQPWNEQAAQLFAVTLPQIKASVIAGGIFASSRHR